MTTGDPPRDPARPPLAAAGGCLVTGVMVYVELSIGIAIAYLVAEQVVPGLAARGYNVRTGSGVLIAMALGGVVAIYPVIWMHRLGRRLRVRMGLRRH